MHVSGATLNMLKAIAACLLLYTRLCTGASAKAGDPKQSATVRIIRILFVTVKIRIIRARKMALQYVKIRLTQFIIYKHV